MKQYDPLTLQEVWDKLSFYLQCTVLLLNAVKGDKGQFTCNISTAKEKKCGTKVVSWRLLLRGLFRFGEAVATCDALLDALGGDRLKLLEKIDTAKDVPSGNIFIRCEHHKDEPMASLRQFQSYLDGSDPKNSFVPGKDCRRPASEGFKGE